MKILRQSFDLFSVLVLIFSCFFVFLGFWQIDRANEKKMIIATLSKEPVALTLSSLNNSHQKGYRKVRFESGTWLDQGYVKKNVVKDGELGAQVYRLYCQKHDCIVVNFGWLKMNEALDLNSNNLNQVVF